MSEYINRENLCALLEDIDCADGMVDMEHLIECVNDLPSDRFDYYSFYEEKCKIECLDYIMDVWLDRDQSYQRRMSMINDALIDYQSYKSY